MCHSLLDKLGKYRDNKGRRNTDYETTLELYLSSSTQAPSVNLQISQWQSNSSHFHRSTSRSTCLRLLWSCKLTWPYSYRTSIIVQQNGAPSRMSLFQCSVSRQGLRCLLHGPGLPRDTLRLSCAFNSSLQQSISDVSHKVDRNVPREYGISASWRRSHAGQLPTLISDILPALMWAFLFVM